MIQRLSDAQQPAAPQDAQSLTPTPNSKPPGRRGLRRFWKGSFTEATGAIMAAAVCFVGALIWQGRDFRNRASAEADSRLYEIRREAFVEFCDQFPRALAGAYDMMESHAAACERRAAIDPELHADDLDLAAHRSAFFARKDRYFNGERAPVQPHALAAKCGAVFSGESPLEKLAAAECQALFEVLTRMIRCNHAEPRCKKKPIACVNAMHDEANDRYDRAVALMGETLVHSKR